MDQVYVSLPVEQTGQIRLITIHPGQLSDDIVVTMRCASLDDPNIRFEGLSYTWGDPSNPKTITCNGVPLQATRSLFSSLRRLRAKQRSTFWIDAICINQKDLPERANQVKQMRRIYSMAEVVWVDYGEQLDGTMEMFKLMKSLEAVFDRLDGEGQVGRTIDVSELEALGLPPLHGRSWKLWQELLSRPYFTRVWVIQEFAVAKKLYALLGIAHFNWDVLFFLTTKMRQYGISEDVRLAPPGTALQRIAAIHGQNSLRYQALTRLTYQKGQKPPLDDLLRQSRSVNASNSKDKVFGILGIAGDVDLNDADFAISYDDKETVAELFVRVTKGMIRTNSGYVIDCLVEGGVGFTPRLEDLPS